VTVDAAWIGVLGALGGTLVGGALATWRDFWQWRREEAVRWHPVRDEAYVRFVRASEDYEQVVYRLGQDPLRVAKPWSIERTEIDAAYRELPLLDG
jgi:hypothetical protein